MIGKSNDSPLMIVSFLSMIRASFTANSSLIAPFPRSYTWMNL